MAPENVVIFIDTSVPECEAISANAVKGGARVFVLDSRRDGLTQIADILAPYTNLSAVHVISHGSSGHLYLGNADISSANLPNYSSAFSAIGHSIAADGDLLLYGCNVGAGLQGQLFVDALSKQTGADVAASTDLTGAALAGGNWTLETSTGWISAASLDLSSTMSGTLAAITGTDGDDRLIGTDGDDLIDGRDGGDFLIGGVGNDTIMGGMDGRYGDTVDYSAALSAMNVDLAAGIATGGAGNDTLSGIEHINGSKFSDVLKGNAATNLFRPGLGNDTVDGGAGQDVVMYEDATSAVTINLKLGTASGTGIGSDRLISIENVHGTNFNDVITLTDQGGYTFGRGGDDSLIGGSSYDTFFGGLGADTMDGGAGWDNVDYGSDSTDNAMATSVARGVVVNLTLGTATDNWGSTDVLRNIESVHGTAMGDRMSLGSSNGYLSGRMGDDTLLGGTGNDGLDGGGGTDSLNGGGGTDNFTGGSGADVMDGGAGIDQVNYGSTYSDGDTTPQSGTGVVVDLTTGLATDNWGNQDKLFNIENVGGSSLDDRITGNSLSNAIWAGAGNDTIDGAGGYDTIVYSDASSSVVINLATGLAYGAGIGYDLLTSIENVQASSFSDIITVSNSNASVFAGSGDDSVSGGFGNDNINGGDGNDSLSGGIGNDYIDGGNGNDSLFGGEGQDGFQGGVGNDTIDGGAVLDRIGYTDCNSVNFNNATAGVNVNLALGKAYDGTGGIDKLININIANGSTFDDVLTGSTALIFEIFNGGAGDDVINGGAITDKLNQRNSNRVTYQSANAGVTVDLAEGTATGGGGNDIVANMVQLMGSNFNDVLLGSDSDLIEQFDGLAGSDRIDGRGGIDMARYERSTAGVYANLVTGSARDGFGGTDTLFNIEGLRGSNFNDTLIGGNANNGTGTTDGFEFFIGGAGNDSIDGGVGYDRVDYNTSTAGVTVVLGGTGYGSAQDGFGGIDRLFNIEAVRGSAFNDVLTGSDTRAFESFEGREGSDIINGKAGIDRVDYERSTAGVRVDLTAGTAADGYGYTDTLLNIENVRGSRDFNDSINGNAQANSLEGLGGNDTLNGQAGIDTMIGGDGSDTYYVDTAGDVVTETNAILSKGGNDIVISSISYTLGANVENLRLNSSVAINGTGNALNNVIYAGAGANVIDGGGGYDTLSYTYATSTGTTGIVLNLGILNAAGRATASGLSGLDQVVNIENLTGSKYNDSLTGSTAANTLDGGAGNDTLSGGSGNDKLIGGDGNDSLNGGLGIDNLTGGAGLDSFIFNTALGSTNRDTISGFSVTDDTIRLENAIFQQLTTVGTLSAENFRTGAAVDINDYILYNSSTGALIYDADGNAAGAGVEFALIGTGLALSNADFIIY
jgi:Ca2+-binding RTX toxin-like protein